MTLYKSLSDEFDATAGQLADYLTSAGAAYPTKSHYDLRSFYPTDLTVPRTMPDFRYWNASSFNGTTMIILDQPRSVVGRSIAARTMTSMDAMSIELEAPTTLQDLENFILASGNEGWPTGDPNVVLAQDSANRYANVMTVTVPQGSTKTVASTYRDNILSGLNDVSGTYVIELVLPAFPAQGAAAHLDLANSFIDFTSDGSGGYAAGQTDSVPFNASLNSLTAGGNLTFRINRNTLVNANLASLTGIRFRLAPLGTGNVVVKFQAMRVFKDTVFNGTATTALTVTGDLITDAVRAGGIDGDGLSNDSSYGIWTQAINYARWGNAFNNAVWVYSNASVVPNSVADVYGNITADAITTSNTTHSVLQAIPVSATLSYTFSFWAKRGTMTDMKYSVYNNTGAADIVAPTSYYSQTDAGGGWRKISVSFTAPVGCTSINIYPLRNSGVTGTVHLWRAQLEQGPYPTPYKDTDANSQTRFNGRVKVNSPLNYFNETQGWVAVRVRMGFPSSDGSNRYFFDWSDDGTHCVQLLRISGTTFTLIRGNGTQIQRSTSVPYNVGDFITIVAAWTSTQLRSSYNGAVFTNTAASTQIPTLASTIFDIGSNAGNGFTQANSDVLWFAAGSGTLTDTDAAAFNAFGNTDPALDTVPSPLVSLPKLVWAAKTSSMSVLGMPTIGVETKRNVLSRMIPQRGAGVSEETDSLGTVLWGTTRPKNSLEVVKFNSGHIPTSPNTNSFSFFMRYDSTTNSFIRFDFTLNSAGSQIALVEQVNGAATTIYTTPASSNALSNSTDYYAVFEVQDNNIRATVYNSRGAFFGTQVYTTGWFPVTRTTRGYSGYDFNAYNYDFQIDWIKNRHAEFATFESLPFKSFTPVVGASLDPKASLPNDLSNQSFVASGDATVTVDTTAGNPPPAYKFVRTGVNLFGGFQTSGFLFIGDPQFLTLDGDLFPTKVANRTFRVVLIDKYDTVAFNAYIPNLKANQWNHFSIPVVTNMAPANYRVVIQQVGYYADTFWLQNFKVNHDTVAWYLSPDAGVTYFPVLGDATGIFNGVNFGNQGTDMTQLKIRAAALSDTAWIQGYEVVPKYENPGHYDLFTRASANRSQDFRITGA